MIENESKILEQHSILLNAIAWKIAKALGKVPEGAAEIYENIEALVDELIEENTYLTERLSDQLPDFHNL